MTKDILIMELEDLGCNYTKIIFHAKSPYQKRRYKKEFIGWEAWLYNGKSKVGTLLNEEMFYDKDYLKDYILTFNN